MNKTILCAIRVSTERQETESQKQEMLSFCKSIGYAEENIEWIEVAGASARKLNNKYIQMLEDIQTKIKSTPSIKAIAFWHLNRLGRIESKLMEMKEWFIANRIQVFIKNPTITLFEDLQTGKVSASAEIAWAIFAAMVKFDTQEMFEKMVRGKKRNAQNKKYNGGIHIKTGYKVDENNYIVIDYDSSDYELILLIYNEFATGKWSTMTLAKDLRARGIKKANGEWVSYHFIRNLIHDTSYIGYSSKYGCDRIYDPIISKELFDRCQQVMKNNMTQQPKATKYHYFGIKLIKCPVCGYNFVAQAKTYHCFKHSQRAIYDYAVDNEVCDNSINIGVHVIDGLLWRIASEAHIVYLYNLSSENKDEYMNSIEVLNQKINESKRLLNDIENKKLRIHEGYIDGIYDKKIRDSKLSKVDIEVVTIKQQILSYEDDIAKCNKLIYDMENSVSCLDKIKAAMFTTDNISDEKEMYDIVHQHISVVYAEQLMVKDKKTAKLTVVMSDGTIVYYLYFMWAKKGIRVFRIDPNGLVVPYGFQNIIRDDSNSQELFKIDENYPTTFAVKCMIEECLQDKEFFCKNFPTYNYENCINRAENAEESDAQTTATDTVE